MDRLAAALSVLPAPMRDPVLFAVPFFLLLLAIEWTAARKLEDSDTRSDQPARGAYRSPDARASISMGLV